jgi:DNA-binding CsgD family transcriptional regulator
MTRCAHHGRRPRPAEVSDRYARQERHVLALAVTGLHTAPQIASMTGILPRLVRMHLARNGIEVPRYAQSQADRHIDTLIIWHAVRGANVATTARLIGLSQCSVRKRRDRLCIGNFESERRAERLAEVARLTRAGYTALQISERLGITKRQVARDRHDTGVARPAAIPMSHTEHRLARALLADGASYAETARTIGRSECVLAKHYPGYAKPRGYASEVSAMTKALAAIPAGPAAISNSRRAS